VPIEPALASSTCPPARAGRPRGAGGQRNLAAAKSRRGPPGPDPGPASRPGSPRPAACCFTDHDPDTLGRRILARSRLRRAAACAGYSDLARGCQHPPGPRPGPCAGHVSGSPCPARPASAAAVRVTHPADKARDSYLAATAATVARHGRRPEPSPAGPRLGSPSESESTFNVHPAPQSHPTAGADRPAAPAWPP
jgi:hypothetical protein